MKQCFFFSKLSLAYNHLNDRVRKGQVYDIAWNNTSVELVEVAELHGRVIIIETFYSTVNVLKKSVSKELRIVLEQLLELYAVFIALKCGGHLLRVSTKIFINCLTRIQFFSPVISSLCKIKTLVNG